MLDQHFSKKKYVLIYAYDINFNIQQQKQYVLLVHKNRPAWQAGCYNLLGGKIEPNETPYQAAIRELKEESGLDPVNTDSLPESTEPAGMVINPYSLIYCFSIPVDHRQPICPRAVETESVQWHCWQEIQHSKLLMPNLRIIVPLMIANIANWYIHGKEIYPQIYDVNIRLFLNNPVQCKYENYYYDTI